MRDIVVDGTGIRVTRLGYGTGSLHHCFSSSGRQRLLHEAAAVGIRHFDTAPSYGLGLAETDLGRFLHRRRSLFTLATKVGLYPQAGVSRHTPSVWLRKAAGKFWPAASALVGDWSVTRAESSLDQSLRRLSTDYVDFLFLHEPKRTSVPTEAFLDWLEREVARGRVRAWGIAGSGSNLSPFVAESSPLAKVVQTQDSLDERQADFLLVSKRALQFTYGYFSTSRKLNGSGSAVDAIEVLSRNQSGTVLISTRRPARLRAISNLIL